VNSTNRGVKGRSKKTLTVTKELAGGEKKKVKLKGGADSRIKGRFWAKNPSPAGGESYTKIQRGQKKTEDEATKEKDSLSWKNEGPHGV